jgi:hypothetical protein
LAWSLTLELILLFMRHWKKCRRHMSSKTVVHFYQNLFALPYLYFSIGVTKSWSSDVDPGPLVQLGCGTVSGALGATCVYPLQVVRTRWAVDSVDLAYTCTTLALHPSHIPIHAFFSLIILTECKLSQPIQRIHIEEWMIVFGERYGVREFLDFTKALYQIYLKWCQLQVLLILFTRQWRNVSP